MQQTGSHVSPNGDWSRAAGRLAEHFGNADRTSRLSLRQGILVIILAMSVSGCTKSDKSKSAKAEKPATVESYPSEQDIYRIVLTPETEKRLQISTVAAEMRAVPRVRLLGGDLMIPDGRRIAVTAPLTGALLPAGDAVLVVAGQKVSANQSIFRLTPILPPERDVPNAAERVQMANAYVTLVSAQIQADGDVQQASAQVDAARIALTRSRLLLSDQAGSQRQVDESEAALNIATQALKAASERKAILDKLTLETKAGNVTGEAATISIESPNDGIIQTVSARIGQVVNAGAPLFEIVDTSKMWIRVPVYAGLVDEIEATSNASVSGLSTSAESVTATPIVAPPTANALSATVDLYYEIENADARFRPGERVSVQVPLDGEAESLVLPRAAVLLDINGTVWVYVKSGDHEFRRQRVAVTFTTDELAVLSLGPEVGTHVVVDGAAELFGTEFGAGK